jgi:CxxC motif-containing protein
MTEMICITCPMGCHLEIERLSETEIAVTGNRCASGENYAREEILSPRRVVTTTCRVAGAIGSVGSGTRALGGPRRIPLRTAGAFPRERIVELLELLHGLELSLPVQRGQVAIADALGTGVDVIVTRTMELKKNFFTDP